MYFVFKNDGVIFSWTDICGSSFINLQNGDEYNLTTPSYPQTYPSYLDCQWMVTAPQNGYIVVYFLDIDTEFNYDFLSIGVGANVTENSTVSRVSGSSGPTSISVNGSSMWIRFTSDGRVGGSGVFIELQWSSNPGL